MWSSYRIKVKRKRFPLVKKIIKKVLSVIYFEWFSHSSSDCDKIMRNLLTYWFFYTKMKIKRLFKKIIAIGNVRSLYSILYILCSFSLCEIFLFLSWMLYLNWIFFLKLLFACLKLCVLWSYSVHLLFC